MYAEKSWVVIERLNRFINNLLKMIVLNWKNNNFKQLSI